jgi:dimethylamine monooxygenase subunit A
MKLICQSELPEDMRVERALPGVQPLNMADWLHVDDVYAAQMQERLSLMETCRDEVCAQMACSEDACHEACELVVEYARCKDGFSQEGTQMRCPDGRVISLTDDPLIVMGALVQEDMCILQKPNGADEHTLSAAILCFPSLWTLSEKLGLPMGRIHAPVDEYNVDIARRVQRLCDGVKVGRPLWRFNFGHAGPELFQPRAEKDFSRDPIEGAQKYQRAERQSLIRLPKTDAILFSIHTYVVKPRVVG